ncbi:hypothetical protein CROQUDRAFT_39045, partial [Cronartium quercuum f. sp. fusiforme G11]
WKARTSTALFLMTGVARYWDTCKPTFESTVDIAIDKCAIRMIYSTVHTKLRDTVDLYTCAHDIVAAFDKRFRRGGRTAQMATFRSLCQKTFDPTTTPLIDLVQEVCDEMERMERDSFQWTRDEIQAMFIQ